MLKCCLLYDATLFPSQMDSFGSIGSLDTSYVWQHMPKPHATIQIVIISAYVKYLCQSIFLCKYKKLPPQVRHGIRRIILQKLTGTYAMVPIFITVTS